MKRKMEQDRIPGWKGNTAAQCAANQVYALATLSVTVRAALWQTDTAPGEYFTECLDFLLYGRAKKHKPYLTRLLAAQPVPAGAPVAGTFAAPGAVGNDRKLPQTIRIESVQYMLIWLRPVLSACAPSVSGLINRLWSTPTAPSLLGWTRSHS